MVVETFVFGAPVMVVMLGVPIWHSIGECRKGRTKQLRLLRWWLTCGLIVFVSMFSGLVFGVAGFVLSNLPASPPPKPSQVSTDCRILSSGKRCSIKICLGILVSAYTCVCNERGLFFSEIICLIIVCINTRSWLWVSVLCWKCLECRCSQKANLAWSWIHLGLYECAPSSPSAPTYDASQMLKNYVHLWSYNRGMAEWGKLGMTNVLYRTLASYKILLSSLIKSCNCRKPPS